MLQFLESVTIGGVVGFVAGGVFLIWAMQPLPVEGSAFEIRQQVMTLHNEKIMGAVISVRNTLEHDVDRATMRCSFIDPAGTRLNTVTVGYTRIDPNERFYDEVYLEEAKTGARAECAVIDASRTSDLAKYLGSLL